MQGQYKRKSLFAIYLALVTIINTRLYITTEISELFKIISIMLI